jgi:anti-sigma B factor antagonist
MIFEYKEAGKMLVLKPMAKRIDAASSTDFKGQMVDKINEGWNRIILDLAEVEFVDSSGLGVIVSVLKTIGPNGDLVICGVRDTVMSLFRLTRMNRVFQIFASEEEAIATLSKT